MQATLARFTARSIADALRAQLPTCARLLVCGGGVHNPVLLSQLRAVLPGMRVESTGEHGLDRSAHRPYRVGRLSSAREVVRTAGGRGASTDAIGGPCAA